MTGSVQDQVIGTVNVGDVTVTVNGMQATVANRGFQATGVPVANGAGTITVIATDSAGNMNSTFISVVRDATPKGKVLIVSGDAQTGLVRSALPGTLVAQVVDNAAARCRARR